MLVKSYMMEDQSTLEFSLKLTIGIMILCGNSLVIYLYFVDTAIRQKQTNKFVISLAFCDLLVAVIFVPCHELFHNSIQKVIPLPIAGYIASLATLGSLWNLAALTYDRFVAIFDGLRYEEVMTDKKATLLMIGIWVSDFAITFLPLSWKLIVSDCTNILILHIYQFILVVAMVTVHLILIGLYIALFKANRSHLRFSQQQIIRFAKERRHGFESKDYTDMSHCEGKMTVKCEMTKCKETTGRMSLRKDDTRLVKEEKDTSSNAEDRKNEISVGDFLSSDKDCVNSKNKPLSCCAGRAIERLCNSRAICIELRAAKVILVLFIFNTICWLPTVTLNVVYLISWLNNQPRVHMTLKSISSYCFLLYSLVNPWIYGLLKTDFKKAAKRHILRRRSDN